jgi:pyruvate dehydrogenase E1 component alpha subunit
VVLCLLGDGSANAGVFFEVMNMASLWDLPIIFLIENNKFAMGTRIEFHAADTELHKRAEPFRIEHERLDGMDVEQVAKDAARIVEHVRTNQRPYLVEVMTYRFVGHGAADVSQQLYRTDVEVEEARKRDPIKLLTDHLEAEGIATPEDLERWDIEAQKVVDEAYAFADSSPEPPPEDLMHNVYADITPEGGH